MAQYASIGSKLFKEQVRNTSFCGFNMALLFRPALPFVPTRFLPTLAGLQDIFGGSSTTGVTITDAEALRLPLVNSTSKR